MFLDFFSHKYDFFTINIFEIHIILTTTALRIVVVLLPLRFAAGLPAPGAGTARAAPDLVFPLWLAGSRRSLFAAHLGRGQVLGLVLRRRQLLLSASCLEKKIVENF